MRLLTLALVASCVDDPELSDVEAEILYTDRGILMKNLATAKCIDIPDASSAWGVAVNQFRCHGWWNQQFQLVQISDSLGGGLGLMNMLQGIWTSGIRGVAGPL